MRLNRQDRQGRQEDFLGVILGALGALGGFISSCDNS
jgi:hypothetical protein